LRRNHWWNRSWKTYTAKSHDPIEARDERFRYFRKRWILHRSKHTIQLGESIGVDFSEPRDIQGFRVARSSFEKNHKSFFLNLDPKNSMREQNGYFGPSLIHTKEALVNLKNIFGVDDYNWSVHKKEALFETLLWQFGGSIAVTERKIINR
jgi:hypothetical protein